MRFYGAILLAVLGTDCGGRAPAEEGLKLLCPDALGAFLVREDDQEAVVAFIDPNDNYRDHLVRLTYDPRERKWQFSTPPRFKGALAKQIWYVEHTPCVLPRFARSHSAKPFIT